MPASDGEPLYDLDTKSWDKVCPCILAEQRDPECPWHGRAKAEAAMREPVYPHPNPVMRSLIAGYLNPDREQVLLDMARQLDELADMQNRHIAGLAGLESLHHDCATAYGIRQAARYLRGQASDTLDPRPFCDMCQVRHDPTSSLVARAEGVRPDDYRP